MENPFDRFNKNWEDKSAKKKAGGKKRWFLSKQYLQPLEEPDDVVEKEPYSDLTLRNKLICICRSAFYGMKEGLLTGVFLGGCYGILKFLNGSSSAFFGSTGNEENNENENTSKHYFGGGVPKERKSTGRSRRTDTRVYPSLGKRTSGNRNSSISYGEKFSSYRTIEETLYGFNRENKLQNLYAGKRPRNMDLSYSKLPIRIDKYSVSSNSGIGDKQKYISGKNAEKVEKVEIVGYAFVQTTGAFETDSTIAKNAEYGSPKQSKVELEKKYKEEEEEEEEPEPSENSTQTFLFSHPSDSKKSSEKSKLALREPSAKTLKSKESELNEKLEKSSRSLKSKESMLIAKHEKSAKSLKMESLMTPKQEMSNSSVRIGSVNAVDDSVYPSRVASEKEPRESISKGLHKAFSSLKSVTSKNKSRQSVISEAEEEKQKPSRITIVSPKYTSHDFSQGGSAEPSSSVLIESLEPDQSEISTRATNEPSQDSRLRLKESSKTNRKVSKPSIRSSVIIESEVSTPRMSRKSSKVGDKNAEYSKDSRSENLYPSFRAPSYLVNAEDVSNGYASPVMVENSEQQSEHNTIHSKFSENSFSACIESSRAEFEDVGFTGSNISEFQMGVPLRAFSPSVSVSQPDPSKTSKTWSLSAGRDSSRMQAEESAMTQLRDESRITLNTAGESGSVIFSDSGKRTVRGDRSNLSELPSRENNEKPIFASGRISEKSRTPSKYSSERLEKSFISSEQLTEESPVAGSFDKFFVSSELVSEKSRLASKYSSEKSEKSFISSEQVSEESPVEGSFDKSIVLSEQGFKKSRITSRPSLDKSLLSSDQDTNKSHVVDEFSSEKSLLSSECLAESSRARNQYYQNTKNRSQSSTNKSYAGVLAKSNSSLIKDVGPDGSASSVAKGAPAVSRSQKESLDKEKVKEFGLFSSVSDNTIVLYACNCAIVIGILCTLISTTRASLKI